MEKGVKVFYRVSHTYNIEFWATLDGKMRNEDDISVVYDIFPWLLKYKEKENSQVDFELGNCKAEYKLYMSDNHHNFFRTYYSISQGKGRRQGDEMDKLNSQAIDFLINGLLQSPSKVIQIPACFHRDDFNTIYSVPTPQQIAAEKLKNDEIMAKYKEKLVRELDTLHKDIVVNPMNSISSQLMIEKFNDLHREIKVRFGKVSDN